MPITRDELASRHDTLTLSCQVMQQACLESQTLGQSRVRCCQWHGGARVLAMQDWQAEVTAMLMRAEQLKVLLAHWQAHHLSLLASVLQHLHQQEVRNYDMPRPRSSSPNKRPHAASSSQGGNIPATGAQRQSAAGTCQLATGLQLLQHEQQQQTQAALQTEFHRVCLEDEACDSDDDEFFLPVGAAAVKCQLKGRVLPVCAPARRSIPILATAAVWLQEQLFVQTWR